MVFKGTHHIKRGSKDECIQEIFGLNCGPVVQIVIYFFVRLPSKSAAFHPMLCLSVEGQRLSLHDHTNRNYKDTDSPPLSDTAYNPIFCKRPCCCGVSLNDQSRGRVNMMHVFSHVGHSLFMNGSVCQIYVLSLVLPNSEAVRRKTITFSTHVRAVCQKVACLSE